MLYAVFCYVCFVASVLWAAAFLHGFPGIPGLDAPLRSPMPVALLVDVGLVLLFGVQHSVMARPAFKRWWTRRVAPPHERSTYVLASSLALWGLCLAWQPVPGQLWDLRGSPAGVALVVVGLGGALLMMAATFALDHFELFGLAQPWRVRRGRPEPSCPFREPWLYRQVRHPIMLGFLVAFWATPVMSLSRLVFSSLMTVYLLIGVWHEERDLVRQFGAVYRDYQRRVPMLLPRLLWRRH